MGLELSAHKDRQIVVEAVTENESLKGKIFQELDALMPQTAILATNTSSISVTRLASQTQRADRFIGMHFMNPVPMMKLVEVIWRHRNFRCNFRSSQITGGSDG